LSTTIDIHRNSNSLPFEILSLSDRTGWACVSRGVSRSFVWATASLHCTCRRTGCAKCRTAGRDQVDLRPACVINSPDFTGETIVKATPFTRLS